MKRQLEALYVLYVCICLMLCQGCGGATVATSKLRVVSPLHTRVSPTAATSGAQQPDATYFFMDENGSYKYGYDSGKGYEGQQSADQTNEVTGHYTFQEKGVPYMVRYKAGVHGYQPVLIAAGSAAQSSVTQYAQSSGNRLLTRTTPEQQAPAGTFSAATQQAGSIQPALQFVQDAMRQMQRQPVQISFASQQMHLEQDSDATATKAQLQKINSLSERQQQRQQPTTALPKRPYAFSYQADRSSHSESADSAGNILGKYSYYDEAGYHDLSYKAGDDIGFVVLGGSLSAAKTRAVTATARRSLPTNDATAAAFTASSAGVPQLVVNVSQEPNNSYSYEVQPPLAEHSSSKTGDGRSLRKFRRFAK